MRRNDLACPCGSIWCILGLNNLVQWPWFNSFVRVGLEKARFLEILVKFLGF